jgi:RAT1-interacting protein
MTVQSFKTLEIPRMVRGKPDAWNPQICLAWGETFLTWIKRHVALDSVVPESIWRVKFTPHVGVDLTLLQEDERREVEAGEDRVGFLPDWYWKEIQDVSGEHGSTSGTKPAPTGSSATSAPSASALPTGWQI